MSADERPVNRFTGYLDTGDSRISPEATSAQVSAFSRLLDVTGGRDTLVDVGCGDARHSVVLARGFRRVVGIDVDRSLLSKAATSPGAPENLSLVRADMRQVPLLSGSADGVLNGFSSWGFFGPAGDLDAVAEMGRVLRPGGVLVLDYGNIVARARRIEQDGDPDPVLGRRVLVERFETSGVVRRSWVDDDLRYHWVCRRAAEDEPLIAGRQQGYPVGEIVRMLDACGLEVPGTGIHGDYDLRPYSDDEKRIIVRAVRR